MLMPVRMALASRGAAVLVAAMLSGGPRLLALHAPVETHRCGCKAHGAHECDCPICRRAALSAQAADDQAPPCHRAAARKQLSCHEQTGTRRGPVVEGRCGEPDRPLITPAGLEPFFPPADSHGIAGDRNDSLLPLVQVHHRRAVPPETPPPRAT